MAVRIVPAALSTVMRAGSFGSFVAPSGSQQIGAVHTALNVEAVCKDLTTAVDPHCECQCNLRRQGTGGVDQRVEVFYTSPAVEKCMREGVVRRRRISDDVADVVDVQSATARAAQRT